MVNGVTLSYELRVRRLQPQPRAAGGAGEVNRYGDSAYYVSLNERESAPFEGLYFQKASEAYAPESGQKKKIKGSVDIFA
ncbi:MAG: hypothetical protein AB1805_12810 [Nitrospirota bacterium]